MLTTRCWSIARVVVGCWLMVAGQGLVNLCRSLFLFLKRGGCDGLFVAGGVCAVWTDGGDYG
jgi:hypothetical protein